MRCRHLLVSDRATERREAHRGSLTRADQHFLDGEPRPRDDEAAGIALARQRVRDVEVFGDELQEEGFVREAKALVEIVDVAVARIPSARRQIDQPLETDRRRLRAAGRPASELQPTASAIGRTRVGQMRGRPCGWDPVTIQNVGDIEAFIRTLLLRLVPCPL